MPGRWSSWNITRIVPKGRWSYRVQDEVYWEADFPGVGRWTSKRWWMKQPREGTFNLGNTGKSDKVDAVIESQGFPGFASLSMPGMLRIAWDATGQGRCLYNFVRPT